MRIWVVCGVWLLACCSSDRAETIATAKNFFPLKTGQSFVYSVDSTVYQQSVATSYHYDLRMVVTDSFPDATGGMVWVLQRAKRSGPESEWISLTTWSAQVSNYKAIVNEGNIPYVKLIAPLANGSSWNGNEYNAIGGTESCPGSNASTCDLYFIESFGMPFSTSAETFQKTVTVRQSNEVEDLFVSRDERSEVYGLSIGLISRKILHYDYCQNQDCYGQQLVESGIDYQQTLSSYGHE